MYIPLPFLNRLVMAETTITNNNDFKVYLSSKDHWRPNCWYEDFAVLRRATQKFNFEIVFGNVHTIG